MVGILPPILIPDFPANEGKEDRLYSQNKQLVKVFLLDSRLP
jgi:hypothetical protein